MKRFFILMMLCASTIFGFSTTEYINDKHCIYAINTVTLQAEVCNFCTKGTSVTIPSSFTYLGDTYTVVSIKNTNFQPSQYELELAYDLGLNSSDLYSEYSFMDFDEIRARIIELNLPESLEELGSHAFSGLTRLRKITIPTNIKKIDFTESPFRNNSRLQEIVFLGLESITYYEYTIPNNPFFAKELTRSLYSDPQLFKSVLIKTIKEGCPNLIRIHIPHLEKIQHDIAILNQYNQSLKDSILTYNEKLASHPYYIVYNGEKAIPDFAIRPGLAVKYKQYPTQLLKENYLLDHSCLGASNIKQMHEQKLSTIRSDYQKINSSMETICKTKDPEHHANVYYTLHPDFAIKVDSIQHSYRCKYTTTKVAITLLANEVFDEPTCQDTQYSENTKLFKSKKEFLELYDELSSEDFTQELNNRTQKINYLDEKLNTEDFKNLIFLDAKILGNSKLIAFIDKYEELKEMCNYPVSEFINHNTKMLKEYQKSTNYWSSMDEFFEAYISGNYKQILKNKKKQK